MPETLTLPAPINASTSSGSRLGWWIVLLATWALLMALGVFQISLSMTAFGQAMRNGAMESRFAMAMVALPAFAIIDLLTHRIGVDRIGWSAWGSAVIALAVATVYVGTRWVTPITFALTGVRVQFFGSEIAKGIADGIMMCVSVGAAMAYELHGRLRTREAQAMQLEARLSEARLQALASQLQPHFLFNTLNAVATLVHRDPDAADATLTRLADLLRATLRQPQRHEIPLRDELALLDRYIEIMRVRYGQRLAVVVDADDALGDVLVPPFVLQPLVENALEHGVARRAGPGAVRISAVQDGARLRLEVVDDGPGPMLDAGGEDGIGLPNTRRRLATLYGDAQRLVLEPVVGGGARAVVELPARREAIASRGP